MNTKEKALNRLRKGRENKAEKTGIHSIRVRILLVVIAVLIIGIAQIGIYIGVYSSRVLQRENESNLTVLNQSANSIVDNILDSNMQSIKLFALDDLYVFMTDYNRSKNISEQVSLISSLNSKLVTNLLANKYVDSYTILDLEQNFIESSGDSRDLNEELYSTLVEGGVKEYLVSDMYFFNGTPKIDAYFPIRHFSVTIPSGVLVVTIDITSLFENINGIKLGNNETSSTYVVADDGVILYHLNEELIGQSIPVEEFNAALSKAEEELKAAAEEDESIDENGFIQVINNYSLNGEAHVGSVSKLHNNFQWYIITTVGKDEMGKVTTSIISTLILLSLIIVGIGFAFSLIVSKQITKAILTAEELINKTSQLDLVDNEKYEALQNNMDETGKIARAIFNMISSLKSIAVKITASSNLVLSNSKSIHNISEEVQDKLTSTTMNTQQLSAGMQQVAATSENIDYAVGQMSNSIDEINKKVESAVELSQDIELKAQSIKSNAMQAKDNSEKIYKDVKQNIKHSMANTEKSIKEIANFSNVIKGIAAQTNLLSLNASIEAARAGEHGKGFSVVAQEIRQLATQSSDAVKDIEHGVSQIALSINDFEDSSQRLLNFVEKDVNKDYVDMVNISDEYNKDTKEINDIMHRLNETLVEFQEITHNITRSINETSVTTTESANEVAEIAEQANEILENITSINKILVNNNNEVESLISIVGKFKIE